MGGRSGIPFSIFPPLLHFSIFQKIREEVRILVAGFVSIFDSACAFNLPLLPCNYPLFFLLALILFYFFLGDGKEKKVGQFDFLLEVYWKMGEK